MARMDLESLFNSKSKNAVVIGTGWPLCETICRTLAQRGLCVIILDDKTAAAATAIADKIIAEGGQSLALPAQITHKTSLSEARDSVMKIMGQTDILITGTRPTPDPSATRDWLPDLDAIRLSCDVFGPPLAQQNPSHILNIIGTYDTETAPDTPRDLTGNLITGYTQWLSRYLNQKYGGTIHTNSILLRVGPDKKKIPGADRTANELIGTLIWILSAAAHSVNGLTIPLESQ